MLTTASSDQELWGPKQRKASAACGLLQTAAAVGGHLSDGSPSRTHRCFTRLRTMPGALNSNRQICLIGAPWCEGQNLEGADLAPLAMREAGLGDAVRRLGYEWFDSGDVDFAGHFAKQGVKAGSDHHESIALYREWLSGACLDNFSVWARKKSGMNSPEARRPSHDSPPLAEHGNKLQKVDKDKCDAHAVREEVNVVNAKVMGEGLKLIHDSVARAVATEAFVLTVGGDHSIASASISAVAAKHPDIGVIWIDAHADANTPRTSPSGHYHGMPAAHLMGWFEKPGELGEDLAPGVALKGFDWFTSGCLPERRLAYIGLRDVDAEEGRMLRASGVTVFTMRDIDKHGIAAVTERAIKAIDPEERCPIHLSLDIDGVDPFFAPGTGTCARGGLSYREVHYICEDLHRTDRMVSMDLVEVNPGIDLPVPTSGAMHGDDPSLKPASPTVRLAVELVLSALGKTILDPNRALEKE